MKKQDIDIIEIANNISTDDMCHLINIFSDRIDIYIGSIGSKKSKKQDNRMMLSGSLSKENPACLNGTYIQINMEYTDKDNLFINQYNLKLID
jgi:hypothetical protein